MVSMVRIPAFFEILKAFVNIIWIKAIRMPEYRQPDKKRSKDIGLGTTTG
jgi:hypothetical protein